jgi:hypothetical protein
MEVLPIIPLEEHESTAEDSTDGRELLRCPLTGCTKKYKQLSGLRYHLTCGVRCFSSRPFLGPHLAQLPTVSA